MNKNIRKIKSFFKFIFSNDFLLKIIYILIIISLLNLIAGNLEINADGDIKVDGKYIICKVLSK